MIVATDSLADELHYEACEDEDCKRCVQITFGTDGRPARTRQRDERLARLREVIDHGASRSTINEMYDANSCKRGSRHRRMLSRDLTALGITREHPLRRSWMS